MEIIDQALEEHNFTPQELNVVKRMIHTTGDVDYQHIVSISPGAIDAGITAIKRHELVNISQIDYADLCFRECFMHRHLWNNSIQQKLIWCRFYFY